MNGHWDWNGNISMRPTPDEFNSDHVYYYPFTASGSPEVLFQDDGGYGDNSGGLTIQIWKQGASCTDELACNYNPDADTDDGSCDYNCHNNGDYSLSFDGVDDWIEAENIDLTGYAYTIQTWIKVSPVNFPYQTNIIDAYEVSGDNRRWGIYIGGTEDHNGKVAVSGPGDLMSTERIDDNQWHHVAMTRDSNDAYSLYIDGIMLVMILI